MKQTINKAEAKDKATIADNARPDQPYADQAVAGAPFIIAKAGKPMVKVTALDASAKGRLRRIGFMDGQISVPDDFDRMGGAEIARLFGSETK